MSRASASAWSYVEMLGKFVRVRHRRMVRNRISFVRSGSHGIDHIHLDVIHIYAVLLQPPIHQSHVPEHSVSGPGIKSVRRHADDVPVRRVRNVVFHQVGVIVGAALSRDLQVHPPWCVAHADSRLDTKFMPGLLHQTQIHVIGNLALNQRPPDPTFVSSSIHND